VTSVMVIMKCFMAREIRGGPVRVSRVIVDVLYMMITEANKIQAPIFEIRGAIRTSVWRTQCGSIVVGVRKHR